MFTCSILTFVNAIIVGSLMVRSILFSFLLKGRSYVHGLYSMSRFQIQNQARYRLTEQIQYILGLFCTRLDSQSSKVF